jgi:GNAT superfamily N-acetyltransferase
MTVQNLRIARPSDIDALRSLMDRAIRELLKPYLDDSRVAASFEIMGLDTQLIADETYYVVEIEGQIAGGGGWSKRSTLFGGDHSMGRNDAFLNPTIDAARIRAMYTDPAFTRRGIGRAVLAACETAAHASGFRRAELVATMAGQPLYLACGYARIEPMTAKTSQGIEVPLVRMGKILT